MLARILLFIAAFGLGACSQEPDTVFSSEAEPVVTPAPSTMPNEALLVQSPNPASRKTKLQRREVMVGGNDNLDACDTWATVTELNPQGDGFLSVRAWPEVGGTELDRLTSRHLVLICEMTRDEAWAGIVFPASHDGDLADCGLSSPDDRLRHAYDGPCKSGWVARRYLDLSAG